MSDDVLVVKINFVHDKKLFKQIYEDILKQMDHGLVILPYGYDAFVVRRDCDLKVENRALKDNTHNICNTCKHSKTLHNFEKCFMCHNYSNYEEDENYGC